MTLLWMALYPEWYKHEVEQLAAHYPQFAIDREQLESGALVAYGDLLVRPPGGTQRYPCKLVYPAAFPFEPPEVTPLATPPQRDEDGRLKGTPQPRLFDHRHQMPSGKLCLFQRETRGAVGGETLSGIDVLRRAEMWFLGMHTGHWPPDTAQSELEAHFPYGSEILVEDRFFCPGISGHGRLFFAMDMRRYWLDRHGPCPDVAPLMLIALTEEQTIVKPPIDARSELANLYPWLLGPEWAPDKLVAARDLSEVENQPLRHGYWWALREEPRPFHDGAGLLRELSRAAPDGDAWGMLEATMRGDLSTARVHFFGLRYPSRDGQVEWLFIAMPRKRPPGPPRIEGNEAVRKRGFEESQVCVIRVHRLSAAQLRLRNRSVVKEDIPRKTVALIGLGALGSLVADLLAKAGVGHFMLCDSDRLMVGNVARHMAGISEFGAWKTRAVASRLLEINPYLTFADHDILAGSAVESLDRLAAFIGKADLVVSTTADEGVESTINEIALVCRKPVIYARSLRKASMARVFLVRPGKDACKACLAHYAASGRQGNETPPDWIDVPEADQEVILHECGRPVIASSAVDLSFAASLAARVAISHLQGDVGSENHWLWSQTAAGEIDTRLDSPFTTFVGQVPRLAGCPACQEPDISELAMTEEVKQTIATLAEQSADAETCGILIGYVDEHRRAVALRATGPGPKAERSKCECRRDIEYVQAALDKAAKELDTHGLYIGEWHSHLVADPVPSPVDIGSLFGISRAENYLTRCPVMVIAGRDPGSGKIAQLRAWVFPIGGRMYDATLSVIGGSVPRQEGGG